MGLSSLSSGTGTHGGEHVEVEGSFDNWTTRQTMQRSGKDFTIVKLLPSGVSTRCCTAGHPASVIQGDSVPGASSSAKSCFSFLHWRKSSCAHRPIYRCRICGWLSCLVVSYSNTGRTA